MASETTPLLPAISDDAQNPFPPISTAALALPLNPSPFDFRNVYTQLLGKAQPLRAVAFRLVLVLHLLVSQHVDANPAIQRNTIQAFQGLQEQSRRRETLRHITMAILSDIPIAVMHARLPGAIEVIPEDVSVEYILFASFPVDPQASKMLRVLLIVIDLLAHSAIPVTILRDPIIELSLTRMWKFGRAQYYPSPSEQASDLSFRRKFMRVYHAAPTPRAIHAVHLTSHLIYIVLLAQLCLYISPWLLSMDTTNGSIGIRELIVIIYSITHIIFNPWSLSTCPHVFVLSAFVIFDSASPSFNTFAYTLLLLALCLHILFVQFPGHPNLFLLFEPVQWLPLSSFFVFCFRRYLIPTFVFLLPLLLSSVALLSLSLSDTFFNIHAMDLVSASPPAARLAFLGLFCIACFLLPYLSTSVLLVSQSLVTREQNVLCGDWERYGVVIGIDGRRHLIRAILAYTPSRRPYNLAYPPPLNIISLPLAALQSDNAYHILWKIVVGPFAFVAAGLWGWGLQQKRETSP